MSADAIWRYPHAVSSVLVVPPDEEPLTVAEGKALAGLSWPDGDPRDALMQGWIAAARQKVELDTALALLKQTRAVALTYEPGTPIPLPMHALPLISITDAEGTPLRGVVVDRTRRTLTIPLMEIPPISGTWLIESGWPDKAALVKEAPLLRHACGLLTAHFATLGRDLASVDESFVVPEGYEAAIAPFVQIWVT